MKLAGKTALVTGASRGIGCAIAVEFAREDISLAVWFGILAVLISIVPALSALRLSPARALRA